MLEPCEGKLSRTVLRGESGSNTADLLDQILENKQKFISQIMTSKSPVRACEDVDDAALSYEAKKLIKRIEQVLGNSNAEINREAEKTEATISFYVAECMEFPVLGEYHENLTLEEALAVYEKIPAERMNGIKGIGFVLHDGSVYARLQNGS